MAGWSHAGLLGLLLLCGCATTTPDPIQARVQAGTVVYSPYSYPELCVVQLKGGGKEFIQAIPYELSEYLASAVFAYNSDLHELVLVFACGWKLRDDQLKGGTTTQARHLSASDHLQAPSKAHIVDGATTLESVALSFSLPLDKDYSASSAKQTINRLLETGFTLALAENGDSSARLLTLEGDEDLNDPVVNDVVVNSASIDVPSSTTGAGSSPFRVVLECDSEASTVPLLAVRITVPGMVGSKIPETLDQLRVLTDTSIDNTSRYRIEAWQLIGEIPISSCR